MKAQLQTGNLNNQNSCTVNDSPSNEACFEDQKVQVGVHIHERILIATKDSFECSTQRAKLDLKLSLIVDGEEPHVTTPFSRHKYH
jgi:hypothetical protein